MLQFILLMFTAMVGMELFSYLLHRYLFHGVLWKIHRTHHQHSKGTFEWNDLFSLMFGTVAVVLIIRGSGGAPGNIELPLGVGITLYGALYFIIHDLFTHRRFYPFKSDNRLLRMIRRAHQRHHQSVERDGYEPYGLFLFDFDTFRHPPRSRKQADAGTDPNGER